MDEERWRDVERKCEGKEGLDEEKKGGKEGWVEHRTDPNKEQRLVAARWLCAPVRVQLIKSAIGLSHGVTDIMGWRDRAAIWGRA